MDTQPIIAMPETTLIRQYFPVLIVFTAFVLLLAVYVLEIHWSGDATVTTWLQNKMSDLLAALLMGLTGGAIGYAAGKAAK